VRFELPPDNPLSFGHMLLWIVQHDQLRQGLRCTREEAKLKLAEILSVGPQGPNNWFSGRFTSNPFTPTNFWRFIVHYREQIAMSGADIYDLARCGGMRYVEELKKQGMEIVAVEKNTVMKIASRQPISLIPPIPQNYKEQGFEARLSALLLANDEEDDTHRVIVSHGTANAKVSTGLAHQLTANQEIIQAFPDGIYWFDTHWRSKSAFLQELVTRARLDIDQDLESKLGENYLQHTWETWISAPGRRCLFVFDGLEYWDFNLCGLFERVGKDVCFVITSSGLNLPKNWAQRHLNSKNGVVPDGLEALQK
jgi:hypothetical protein